MNTRAKPYNQQLTDLNNKITSLPISELKYHLHLLLIAIQNYNTPYTQSLAENACQFIANYNIYYKNDKPWLIKSQLKNMQDTFSVLLDESGIKNPQTIIYQSILNIAGASLSVYLSLLGAVIGGFCGFIRGIYNKENIFFHCLLGMAAGFIIGGTIGFRTPKKLFKNPMIRQVKFALNGLESAFNTALELPGLTFYRDQAYNILLSDYFDNDKNSLEDFLNQDNQSYEIITQYDELVSPKLKGYIGHHGYIKIPIENKIFSLEFTKYPSNVNQIPEQIEIRKVKGSKILEMAALHLYLQETHKLTLKYILTELKIGERDCIAYVNKILIGTDQPPTKLQRFCQTDKLIGYHVVGFFIENTNTYSCTDTLQMPRPFK